MADVNEPLHKEILRRFGAIRLQDPPEHIFGAIKAIEREHPEALDHQAIGEWCAEALFKQRGSHPLTHPKQVYRQRLQEAARRLEHPFFLTVVMDQISGRIANNPEDPLGLLDEMLRNMPFPAKRPSPAG